MNNFTGYNPSQVEALFDQVQTSANRVSETIVDEIQSGIISPISQALFTPEGVEFFQQFKTVVANTADEIEAAFNSFNESLATAANNWADNVKGEHISARHVQDISLDIDISPIQTNQNGNYGIIEDDAKRVANNLESVKQSITAKLTNISLELEASSAFMGHEQASAVIGCFKRVVQAITRVFDFLTTGDNSLMNSINAAVTKYGSVASNVHTEFDNAAQQ